MERLRDKLTYANVVATLALFIAIGGASAFAASQLGKNSVGSKQLKKNAVTTAKIKKEAVTAAKIKKGTLTGAQINASTLGTVPTAQTANAIAPPEPWHVIGTPGEPPFQNGCEDPCDSVIGAPSPAFYKDREGVVHLEGIFRCNSIQKVAFQLPAGCRPGAFLSFLLAYGAPGRVVGVFPSSGPGVDTSNVGGVRCSEEVCYIDGISFRAES